MLLAGINFSLHYRLLKGNLKIFGEDSECRVLLLYMGLFVVASLIIVVSTTGLTKAV